MASASAALQHLRREFPLGGEWRLQDLHNQRVQIGSLPLEVFGLCFGDGKRIVFGASIESLRTAYFEVVERLCATPGPSTIGCAAAASISNGLAAGIDRRATENRAYAELVERDAILRAWYGWTTPQPFHDGASSVVGPPADLFEQVAVRFAVKPQHTGLQCVGVFAFPRRKELPLAFGFACNETKVEAHKSAMRECLQRLAFLYGEQLPHHPPALAPTPGFHQEWYLLPRHHDLLRNWLHHGNPPTTCVDPTAERPSRLSFVDLTCEHLRHRAVVLKATDPSLLALVFGHDPIAQELPPPLRVHPIA